MTTAETDSRHEIRALFVANPGLLGQTIKVDVLASANADNWIKGNIDRSLPDIHSAVVMQLAASRAASPMAMRFMSSSRVRRTVAQAFVGRSASSAFRAGCLPRA